uniref:fructosamine kinase family protein n=1 Tax=Nocardia seriolae TaxID=37332 RepID=UPI0037C76BCA
MEPLVRPTPAHPLPPRRRTRTRPRRPAPARTRHRPHRRPRRTPEPPARIHGDLWSGNILWTHDHALLIEPAAHGGHRETDLAMLALFGTPHLDRILAAYRETTPLSPGWRQRIPLHQLHPLLVHVVLFGGSYRGMLLAAASAALAN